MKGFSLVSFSSMRWMVVPLLVVALGACSGEQDSSADQEAASTENTEQTAAQQAPTEKLNMNTATEEQFLAVPQVGDHMVHEFFEYRPYKSIRQFRREIGKYVDEQQVAAYEEYVFVPVDPNGSDAATLQQLPGVDETVAAGLIENRPYDSNKAFIEALAGYEISEEQRSVAKTYLK